MLELQSPVTKLCPRCFQPETMMVVNPNAAWLLSCRFWAYYCGGCSRKEIDAVRARMTDYCGRGEPTPAHVSDDAREMLIQGRELPPHSFAERLSDGFWMLAGGSLK